MKILITVLSLILFSSFSAHGQSSRMKHKRKSARKSRPWFHITPVAGVYAGSFQKGISTDGSSEDTFQGEGEATTGVLLDYNSHKAGFSLQTGLVLSKSNAVFKATRNNINGTVAYVDNYLSIPLVGKFYPFSSSARWLYLRFGVNLSYLMNSKRTTTLTSSTALFSSTSSSTEEVDLRDRREKGDVQAIAGLGVLIPISKRIGVTVEGSYYHGFINTDKTEGSSRQELFTKGMSGILGISFSL